MTVQAPAIDGPRPFRAAGKLARFFTSMGVWLGGLSVVAMMLHVVADIVLRQALGIVLPGTLEIVSFFYMVACICLAFPIMQLAGEQVIVQVFLQRLPRAALRPVDLVATLLTLAYVGYLAVAAVSGAWSATRDGEMALVGDTDLITWPSRWINVAGMAIMSLVVAWQVWAIWIRQPSTLPADPDAIPGEPI